DDMSVILFDEDGDTIPNATLTGIYLGQTITAKLICGGNACWSSILVEDKIAPILTCDTVEVNCYDVADFLPDASDNCDSTRVIAINAGITTPLCDSLYSGQMIRSFVAIDEYGNYSDTCIQVINILRP